MRSKEVCEAHHPPYSTTVHNDAKNTSTRAAII
ncbi:MAG: hypothetical protein ACI8Q3_002163 [Marinomonas primoryensis]|jgi:hypothetical protein